LYWKSKSMNLNMRYQGFKQVVEAAGGPLTKIAMPGWTIEENLDVLCEALQAKNPPTAYFCISDVYASMLYKAAEKLVLKIPEDLSVLGFAGLPWGQFLSPSLDTMRQDGGRIGVEATRTLLKRISGSKARASNKRLKVELIERGSVRTI